jgi:hypothetical protein
MKQTFTDDEWRVSEYDRLAMGHNDEFSFTDIFNIIILMQAFQYFYPLMNIFHEYVMQPYLKLLF